jgi:hypothetical protein
VVRLARQGKREPGLADDRRHCGDAEVLGFEDGPLLDMDFNKAQCVAVEHRFADARRVQSEGAQLSFDTDVAGVFEREKRRVKAAGYGAAAEVRHTIADAFFFREGDDFDGQRQAERVRDRYPFESHGHAQHPVERAGVGHRINVRAENEALAGGMGRLPNAAQVSGCVQLNAHAESFHAGTQAGVDLVHGRGKKAARDAAGFLGHGGDVTAFGDGSRGAVIHERTSSRPRGSLMNS